MKNGKKVFKKCKRRQLNDSASLNNEVTEITKKDIFVLFLNCKRSACT